MISPINVDEGLSCCGIGEVDGICHYADDAGGAVRDILCDEEHEDYDDYEHELNPPEVAHLILTQADHIRRTTGYGYAIKSYIERHKLGTVIVSKPARNPNTRSYITTFVWTLDRGAIKAWAKREGIRIN